MKHYHGGLPMSGAVSRGLLVLVAIGQGPTVSAQDVGAEPSRAGPGAQEILVRIDAVSLALAELALAEDKLEHARILFEKNFITRGEVQKDQQQYDDRLVALTMVSSELADVLALGKDEQVVIAGPLLKRLLLHPVLPPAELTLTMTSVYDRLASTLDAAARTPAEGLAAHLYRLRTGDLESRVRAVSSLGQIPQAAEEVLPYLIEALDDEELRVVQEAVTSIGLLGTEAKSAIPALEKLTEHDDPQIVERAKAALRQVRGR